MEARLDWWDFGEHSGYRGDELALHFITCGFCDVEGNFQLKPGLARTNSRGKTLKYDFLTCTSCGNHTMVFWAASSSSDLHNFRTLPYPVKTKSFPKHWPADIGRNWLQAKRSLEGQNWDAAAIMARSAVQLILRYQEAKGANLKQEIDDLAMKGLLPPIIKDWAHEVRELGNDNAHPTPGAEGTSHKDAADIVEFLGFLLRFTYDLPYEIKEFRARRKT